MIILKYRTDFKIVLGLSFFLSIISCGDGDLPREAKPQNSYMVDTLIGPGNGTTRLNQDKIDVLVRNIELGLSGKVKSMVVIHNDERADIIVNGRRNRQDRQLGRNCFEKSVFSYIESMKRW